MSAGRFDFMLGCCSSDAGRVVRVAAGYLGQQIVVTFSGKGWLQTHLMPHPTEGLGGAGGFSRSDQNRLGEIHHRAVVAIGLVGLEHGELRVVPRADALVAVDPAKLKDPLHAANEQPLQMELQGDPEHQRHVEGVVVGFERAGSGAASGLLESRPFNLKIAPVGQRLANRRDDSAAGDKSVTDTLAMDQVEIPHPLSQFGIDQPVVLVGRGLE